MDVWGWIIAYALGLTLLQLVLYRYLLDRGDTLTDGGLMLGSDGDVDQFERVDRPRTNDSSGRGARGDYSGRSSVHSEGIARGWTAYDEAIEGRCCPHCGAVNEPDRTFTLCWNCTQRLE